MIKHECFLNSKDPEHEAQAGLILSSLTLLGSVVIVVAIEEPLGLVWESIYSNNSPNWVARALK